MIAKLTLRSVETAKPLAAPYEIRDADITGLLLRVQPTGVKAFYVDLARGIRVRIGRYPVLTVEGARTQAKAILGEFARTGARPKPKVKVESFGDFIRDRYAPWFLAERKHGARNIAAIDAQFGDLYKRPLGEISAWLIEKHKATRLAAGLNPATVNRDLVRIKAALAKAVEWELLPEHPLRSVKRAKGENSGHVRFLSDTEEQALRMALVARERANEMRRERGNAWRSQRGHAALIATTGYCDHLMPMVLVSLNTGLRRGELTAITWADLNVPGKLLTVRAGYAKSGKSRHLPLNSEAMDVLRRYRMQSIGEGRIFPILDAKTAWATVLKTAGIHGFRWHDLRHSFASRLVMAGVDLNTVRELLGHASLAMTIRYAHLAPEHKAAAVERIVAAQARAQ